MDQSLNEMSFEAAFGALQGVIEELRGETLTLERSLELYQNGTALSSHCNMLLIAAELRITQSNPGEATGQGVRETFLEVDW